MSGDRYMIYRCKSKIVSIDKVFYQSKFLVTVLAHPFMAIKVSIIIKGGVWGATSIVF